MHYKILVEVMTVSADVNSLEFSFLCLTGPIPGLARQWIWIE